MPRTTEYLQVRNLLHAARAIKKSIITNMHAGIAGVMQWTQLIESSSIHQFINSSSSSSWRIDSCGPLRWLSTVSAFLRIMPHLSPAGWGSLDDLLYPSLRQLVLGRWPTFVEWQHESQLTNSDTEQFKALYCSQYAGRLLNQHDQNT